MNTVTTPNHAQVNRIAYGLNSLAEGKSAPDWRGNSYAGVVGYAKSGAHLYTLIHWSTPIAQLHVSAEGKVSVLYFDARYISSTTRSFQGRIYRALTKVHGIRPNDLTAIGDELAKSTGNRGVLRPHTDIEV